MEDIDEEVKTLISQSFQKRFSIISALDETWHPPTDVYETGAEIIVKIELPGIAKGDIHVTLEDKRLIVQGARRDETVKEKVSYHRMEINYGPFRRTVVLPSSVKIKSASASYRNGFLEIRMPFAEEHVPRTMKIPIE